MAHRRRLLPLFLAVLGPLAVVPGRLGLLSVTRSAKAADSGSESYYLGISAVSRVVAVMHYEVTYPQIQPKEWIIFCSQAPELTGQIKVRTTMEPAGEPMADHSDPTRIVLRARVPADETH